MQKRVHSREFKLEVVRQAASGEKRLAQLCREYGLAESVLSRWRKEYQEKGEAAFQVPSSGEITTQEQKIAELERFCGQLALENQGSSQKFRVRSHGSLTVLQAWLWLGKTGGQGMVEWVGGETSSRPLLESRRLMPRVGLALR